MVNITGMLSTLPDQTKIGYAHLRVEDLDRALQFYAGRIGFQIINQTISLADLSADGKTLHLRLSSEPGASRQPRGAAGLFHIAIRLPSRRALGRLFNRLSELDTPFQGASDHLVSEAIYLADPEANGLELYTDRPRQDWPWHGDKIVMSTDPLDWRSLLAEGIKDSSPWTGIDPQTDIGHMHIQVSSLTSAEQFYSKLIGLKVMQRDYPGALFMAAGGYHHHLGTNTWGSNGQKALPGALGLKEFSLVVPDAAARQEIIKRVNAAGLASEIIPEGVRIIDHDGIALVLQ